MDIDIGVHVDISTHRHKYNHTYTHSNVCVNLTSLADREVSTDTATRPAGLICCLFFEKMRV